MHLADAAEGLVAQSCTLRYRRLAVGRERKSSRRLADCKSAIQQIENLRHGFAAPYGDEICRLAWKRQPSRSRTSRLRSWGACCRGLSSRSYGWISSADSAL